MGKRPARSNLGGPLVPAGGLTFISAAFDNRLRVFDTTSGKVLWETELPAAAHATPMTYVWKEANIDISAGGHGKLGTKLVDAVMAFTLRGSPAQAPRWNRCVGIHPSAEGFHILECTHLIGKAIAIDTFAVLLGAFLFNRFKAIDCKQNRPDTKMSRSVERLRQISRCLERAPIARNLKA